MADGNGAAGRAPLLSVAMPTHDTDESHLREAIDSVLSQRHSRWELCVVDDGSTSVRVREVLGEYAARDRRVTVELADANSGISAASNRAVAMCAGEYVAFCDHDDVLAPDTLGEVARAIEADPSVDVLYTDQDKIGPGGVRRAPFFKPDWSPTYALGAMYVGHLLVVRRGLVEAVGGFDSRFDGIQDFELLLRVSERTERIRHLPRILYHWRAIPGSIAAGADEKSGIGELQARAVSEHLRRRGVPVRAVPHPTIPHRTRLSPEPGADRPKVGIVDYPDAGRSGTAAALNRAAAATDGEYLLFRAANVEPVGEDWLGALLTLARVPSVGIVGPQSVYPDGRVEHAGLALRRGGGTGRSDPMAWWHGEGPVEPVMRGAPADSDGYYGSLSCAREVAAVPASCMLIARSAFERAEGFDEAYRVRYHDADLCLRVREMGLGVVCTPRPRAVCHRLRPPGGGEDMLDRALFVDSWFERLDRGDPYLGHHLPASMAPRDPGAGRLARLRALGTRR